MENVQGGIPEWMEACVALGVTVAAFTSPIGGLIALGFCASSTPAS